MSARKPTRVGVVGIGFGQHVHVPAFRSDARAVVGAICATSQARAGEVAARLAIPRAYGDWRELVADPEIDAVSISVPPVLQPTIAVAAATAGKHVFCEKPLASDAPRAEGMLAAARTAGVVHAVDFEFRETQAWQRAKEICEEGVLGTIRHAAVSWRIETLAYRRPTASWKLREADGGGTLNLFVSHSLDYIEWLLGRVTRVAARLAPAASCEAQVDAWMELAGGTPVALSVAANALFGSGHRVEIYGEAGTLVLENRTSDYVSGFELLVGTRIGGALSPVELAGARAGGDGRVLAVSGMVRRFLDAIDGGPEMRPNIEHGLRVQALIDKIRRANEAGQWQS